MTDKNQLINKGNELIDIISAAMSAIEITDGAKLKVENPNASVCVTIPIEGTDYTDQYDLAQCLSEKAINNIKNFILEEMVKAQDEACRTLDRMGLHAPDPEPKKVMPDRSLAPEKVKAIQDRAEKGESVQAISREVGVSTSTVKKYMGRSAS